MPRPTTHVIFDLDGVLLDTEPMYTEATSEVLREFGKTYGWDLKGQMIGRDSKESARFLVRELGLPITGEEYLARRKPLLDRLFPKAEPIAGAPELVQSLVEQGVPLGLATSSERRLYLLKTARHSWFQRFSAVVCGDDPRVQALKPAPDIFLVAAQELGVSPEQCLVIEDSPAGVLSARAAGMRVIAIPAAEMGDHHYGDAERIVRSYAELSLADLGLSR